MEDDEQQITYKLGHTELQNHCIITFVYAKFNEQLRSPLWDRMFHQSSANSKPWCFVGDFNLITSTEEMFEGVPYNMRKRSDFIVVIEACCLIDLSFSGINFMVQQTRNSSQNLE